MMAGKMNKFLTLIILTCFLAACHFQTFSDPTFSEKKKKCLQIIQRFWKQRNMSFFPLDREQGKDELYLLITNSRLVEFGESLDLENIQ